MMRASPLPLIPAQAGIQWTCAWRVPDSKATWIPACAGMSGWEWMRHDC
jgi:hypothetical protein